MKTTVTSRGQTVVPASLRRRYRISAGSALEWIDTGRDIRVIPLPADIVGALRGLTRGERLAAKPREARRRERERERRR
jgi:AbrB family looped-hinge helix DNA binding protein